jgi:acyl-CoA thioesterase I
MWRVTAAAVALMAALGGCREARPPAETAVTSGSGGGQPATPAPATARRPRVVVLGDSIAAGLGLPADRSFPAQVQRRIDAAGLGFEVVNAGVSGDTSAGGVRRLDWALDGDVRVLVLELGANDGLRGLSVDDMARNLGTIVDRAKARGVPVILCGMEAPPNFGADYTRAFRAAFARVAREHDARFVPFVLAGVAGVPALNQADGIHPNAQGAERVADLVWTALAPLLTSATSS